MDNAEPTVVPYGYCHCGCGERTRLAPQSSARWGWVVGEPIPFIHGHHRRKSGLAYRVEDRGYITPCWVWQRSCDRGGYGNTSTSTRHSTKAHIAYYEAAHGPVPDGLELDHLCRQRACVNPDHLEPVTRLENMRRGVGTKLSRADVAAIRAAPVGWGTGRALARKFAVSPTTISEIRLGKTWSDVT